MDNLYNYFFWYNPYENIWYAIDRRTQIDFFSQKRKNAIYHKSESIESLINKLKDNESE
jgi:hypothetical protein